MLSLYEVRAKNKELSLTVHVVANDSIEAYETLVSSIQYQKLSNKEEINKLLENHDNINIIEIPFTTPHCLITEHTFK